jgi:hypothetical protein
MTDDDDFELIRGTGNVYADLGMKEPEQRQLRAILAGEISKTLATDNLTVRAAEDHRRRCRRFFAHPPGQAQGLYHRPVDDDSRPAQSRRAGVGIGIAA